MPLYRNRRKNKPMPTKPLHHVSDLLFRICLEFRDSYFGFHPDLSGCNYAKRTQSWHVVPHQFSAVCLSDEELVRENEPSLPPHRHPTPQTIPHYAKLTQFPHRTSSPALPTPRLCKTNPITSPLLFSTSPPTIPPLCETNPIPRTAGVSPAFPSPPIMRNKPNSPKPAANRQHPTAKICKTDPISTPPICKTKPIYRTPAVSPAFPPPIPRNKPNFKPPPPIYQLRTTKYELL